MERLTARTGFSPKHFDAIRGPRTWHTILQGQQNQTVHNVNSDGSLLEGSATKAEDESKNTLHYFTEINLSEESDDIATMMKIGEGLQESLAGCSMKEIREKALRLLDAVKTAYIKAQIRRNGGYAKRIKDEENKENIPQVEDAFTQTQPIVVRSTSSTSGSTYSVPSSCRDDENLEDMPNVDWSEEFFSRVTFARDGLTVLSNDSNRIFLYDETDESSKNVAKELRIQFPSIRRYLAENHPRPGKIVEFHMIEGIADETSGNGEYPNRQRKELFMLVGSPGSEATVQEWKEVFQEIRDRLVRSQITSAILSAPRNTNIMMICRILDNVLQRDQVEITVGRENWGGARKRTPPARAKIGNEVYIIINPHSPCDFQYIVGEMKANINPDDLGVTVMSVKKAGDKGVLLIIKEELPGSSENMIRAIQENVKAAGEIFIHCKLRKKIRIMNIDDSVNCEEIKQAIIQNTNCRPNDICLSRPQRSILGEVTIVATLPVPEGAALLNQETIRIGWSQCRVKEKFEIPFCGRCKSFGHSKFTCFTNPLKCLKCRQIGHLAKYCKRIVSCINCGGDHVTGSPICPEFFNHMHENRPVRKVYARRV